VYHFLIESLSLHCPLFYSERASTVYNFEDFYSVVDLLFLHLQQRVFLQPPLLRITALLKDCIWLKCYFSGVLTEVICKCSLYHYMSLLELQ